MLTYKQNSRNVRPGFRNSAKYALTEIKWMANLSVYLKSGFEFSFDPLNLIVIVDETKFKQQI